MFLFCIRKTKVKQKISEMQIPSELLKKWDALKSEGDPQKIADTVAGGCTSQTVRNAFKTGKCSDELFKAIADFYEQKLELIKEYIN